jgi:AcrR family transcriptional regulator
MSRAQDHRPPSERGREWSLGAPAGDHSRRRSERGEGGARGRAERKAPEERRAEIDAASRGLALSEGLSAVTLRGVAARAGVTPALVAHYRPNMDELVAETFRAIVAAELREVAGGSGGAEGHEVTPITGNSADGALRTGEASRPGEASRRDEAAQATPATERLGALVHTLLDGSREDVTLVWVEAWALGRRNETLAAAVREQMDAWQAVMHDLIAAGTAAGEFDVDDPAAVAWQLIGMIDGLNAQALVRWGEGRSVLLTHALEGMLGLARGALAAPAPRRPL